MKDIGEYILVEAITKNYFSHFLEDDTGGNLTSSLTISNINDIKGILDCMKSYRRSFITKTEETKNTVVNLSAEDSGNQVYKDIINNKIKEKGEFGDTFDLTGAKYILSKNEQGFPTIKCFNFSNIQKPYFFSVSRVPLNDEAKKISGEKGNTEEKRLNKQSRALDKINKRWERSSLNYRIYNLTSICSDVSSWNLHIPEIFSPSETTEDYLGSADKAKNDSKSNINEIIAAYESGNMDPGVAFIDTISKKAAGFKGVPAFFLVSSDKKKAIAVTLPPTGNTNKNSLGNCIVFEFIKNIELTPGTAAVPLFKRTCYTGSTQTKYNYNILSTPYFIVSTSNTLDKEKISYPDPERNTVKVDMDVVSPVTASVNSLSPRVSNPQYTSYFLNIETKENSEAYISLSDFISMFDTSTPSTNNTAPVNTQQGTAN